MREQRNNGFTLLELLIAVSILAIIIGMVYMGFIAVTDTAASARDNAEKLRFRQFLTTHLRSHLEAVYIDGMRQQPELAFTSFNEDGEFGPADSLTFCANVPMGGSHALPGMLKTISYEVMEGGGGEEMGAVLDYFGEAPSATLLIRETPLVLSDPGEVTDTEEQQTAEEFYSSFFDEEVDPGTERQIPIRWFDLQFYDGENQEWLDEWDSALEGRMPWAVRVMVSFARTEEELENDYWLGLDPDEYPDLDITVVITTTAGVIDPFEDFNHQRGGGLTTTSTENLTGDVKRKNDR